MKVKELFIRKVWYKMRNIFLYSDSEPNELMISLVHMIALPATICFDMNKPLVSLVIGSLLVGGYQFYAVICGCLKKRLLAAKLAVTVAIVTVINLLTMGLMTGSRVGWVVIMLFAGWNLVRVQREKHYRELK